MKNITFSMICANWSNGMTLNQKKKPSSNVQKNNWGGGPALNRVNKLWLNHKWKPRNKIVNCGIIINIRKK